MSSSSTASPKLRINFVLPPVPKISGGPLAILEYANRFIERGHDVSVTTYPDTLWTGNNPFPWFEFKGPIFYKRLRNGGGILPVSAEALRLLGATDVKALSHMLLTSFGLHGLREIILQSAGPLPVKLPFDLLVDEILTWAQTIEAMPECDLNIATLWSTAYPVFFSRKGKPVYFMQHYEEIFYPLEPSMMMHRLAARLSYALPIYKVANSSWLQRVIQDRVGQTVPFSNNGFVLSDFNPRSKKSESDGVIRIFTYSRPEEWKGFADAVAAMALARNRYGSRIEWHVFGYKHTGLPEDNPYARYTYHPNLPFRELAKLYAASDVALCPSWYESFPLPPLEAMASGTAVITTDYGTEDYALHEKNALVVGTRDIQGMFTALCRLVDDDALRGRLAQAGRETAESFTWERAVDNRERILLDIHEGKTGYDVMASAKLGLFDSSGIEFERAPRDVPRRCGIFWHNGDLYLLHCGLKRHITNPDVIPLLLDLNVSYIEMDDLSVARTPTGFPISTLADVPTAL